MDGERWEERETDGKEIKINIQNLKIIKKNDQLKKKKQRFFWTKNHDEHINSIILEVSYKKRKILLFAFVRKNFVFMKEFYFLYVLTSCAFKV